jgi:lipopolysaccharide cholinephosphotransferase
MISIFNVAMRRFVRVLFFVLGVMPFVSCGGAKFTPPHVVAELYQMMNDAHDIMTRDNVHYWVDGGTLIGAVRHKGLIQWDDDLDICIYPGHEAAFSNLETNFNKLGYRFEKVMVAPDGSIVTNGTHIGYKIFPQDKSYPFLDALFTIEKNGRIYYSTDGLGAYKRREGDQIFLHDQSEVLPLKMVPFGSFQVMAPNDPLPFLHHLYGEDFMDVAYQTHVHDGSHVKKVKVVLSDSTRQPAQPTNRVVKRTSLLD